MSVAHAGSRRPASAARTPETLFAERGLMGLAALIVAIFALCAVVNIPALAPFAARRFITPP
jgi:hypothetical protein